MFKGQRSLFQCVFEHASSALSQVMYCVKLEAFFGDAIAFYGFYTVASPFHKLTRVNASRFPVHCAAFFAKATNVKIFSERPPCEL